MNQQRPVNLDLASLNYPPMAIVSILHRLSGIGMFLLLPVILYFLGLSLQSAESYDHLQTMFQTCMLCKGVLWLFGAAFIFHVIAGLRHLCMDMGFGEQLVAGRRSAIIVMLVSLVLIVLLGVWIC